MLSWRFKSKTGLHRIRQRKIALTLDVETPSLAPQLPTPAILPDASGHTGVSGRRLPNVSYG
jgi:hypothetical protein